VLRPRRQRLVRASQLDRVATAEAERIAVLSQSGSSRKTSEHSFFSAVLYQLSYLSVRMDAGQVEEYQSAA
jgi:hypothetical protein